MEHSSKVEDGHRVRDHSLLNVLITSDPFHPMSNMGVRGHDHLAPVRNRGHRLDVNNSPIPFDTPRYFDLEGIRVHLWSRSFIQRDHRRGRFVPADPEAETKGHLNAFFAQRDPEYKKKMERQRICLGS